MWTMDLLALGFFLSLLFLFSGAGGPSKLGARFADRDRCPLFGRYSGQSGHAAESAETTRMTQRRRTQCQDAAMQLHR